MRKVRCLRMVVVKCLEKIRNKSGAIDSYRLIDQQGQEKILSSKDLKSAIASKQIQVVNLQLTKDNRLIDKSDKVRNNNKYSLFTRDMVKKIDSVKALRFKSNQNLEQLVQRAKEQGRLVKKLSEDIVGIETESNILIFSDKKIELDDTKEYGYVSKGLFDNTKFISIDLRDTDTSKVRDMSYMFRGCQAERLDLSEFDTSKVEKMQHMFEGCNVKELHLGSFLTSNVKSMSYMFYKCAVEELNLSNFDTSKVVSMRGMFEECQAKRIELRSFRTYNVIDMSNMFRYCKAEYLDLSSFNTDRVRDIDAMFNMCRAQVKTDDPKIKGQLVMRSL